jgi:hypothetical protein
MTEQVFENGYEGEPKVLVAWYCPRGGGHIEADPEKLSAVPLYAPASAAKRVREYVVREFGEDGWFE